MKLEAIKLELINWIADLNDKHVISVLLALKRKKPSHQKNRNERKFGSGKQLIGHVSDSFNDPIDSFEQYKK